MPDAARPAGVTKLSEDCGTLWWTICAMYDA